MGSSTAPIGIQCFISCNTAKRGSSNVRIVQRYLNGNRMWYDIPERIPGRDRINAQRVGKGLGPNIVSKHIFVLIPERCHITVQCVESDSDRTVISRYIGELILATNHTSAKYVESVSASTRPWRCIIESITDRNPLCVRVADGNSLRDTPCNVIYGMYTEITMTGTGIKTLIIDSMCKSSRRDSDKT